MDKKLLNVLRVVKNEFFPRKKNAFEMECLRLKILPRYVETDSFLFEKKIKLVDSASYLFTYDELFNKEIYKFKTENKQPYIIDCGANIGLSVIYFKMLYPDAEIIAFEPDNKVFKALQSNKESFAFSNVTLINKACWNEVTTLKFFSEGADAGRTAVESDVDNIIEVGTVRLKEYLNRKVDFLKMDIEGAETVVLEDCKDLLHNVENIFVEYHSFIGQEQNLDRLLSVLKNAGFRYAIQQHGVVSANPFLHIEDQMNMDILLNISAYRHQ